MSSSSNKLWFSLLNKGPYVSNEPNYYNVNDLNGINDLEQNHTIVVEELQAYLKQFIFESHFNINMVETPKSWKVRSLRVWGVEMYDIQKHFPKTLTLLGKIDGVINIGFNLLEPHARIKPHSGDTNAILRCHLGLIIPVETNECAIKVNGEVKHWEQGKVLAFNDAYEHEAWNDTDKQRIILLFDILKPGYKEGKNKICGVVLASLYMQKIGNIFPSFYSLNPVWFWPISYPTAFFMRLLLPVRNYLKR